MVDLTVEKVKIRLVDNTNDSNEYTIQAYTGATDDQLLALSQAIAPLLIDGAGSQAGVGKVVKITEALMEEA